MGPDAKNLTSDRNVQIVETNEVIGTTQFTGDELIIGAGGRAGDTVVTEAGWLKVVTGEITKCTQYDSNGMLSVSDGIIATGTVQSEGGTISLSTLAMVNDHHPGSEFSVDKGYAYGLLLESGDSLCVLEGHRAGKVILDQKGGLLANGTTSAVVVDGGGGLLVYPDEETSNCGINQGGVLMLAGKASNALFTDGAMNNLGDEDPDAIIENGPVYCLGTDGFRLCSSGKTQNLSVNVGGRAEMHVGTLENTVIQGGIMTLLSPTSADESFIVGEDHTPVELTGSVALLGSTSMIIGYDAELQQSMITIRQDDALILGGSTVKGDSVALTVGNTNLNGGKLWLITDAAAHVQLKAKRPRGEGVVCLQTSAKKISSDLIDVKGEITGDIHVKITDASRQTLCNVLKLQPDEDGIGATLQPT